MAYTLTFDAYDIDYAGELIVSVNGVDVAVFPSANNPQNSEIWIPVILDITNFVVGGTNTLRFHPDPNGVACAVSNIIVSVDGQTLLNDPTERTISSDVVPFLEYQTAFDAAATPPPSGVYEVELVNEPSINDLEAWLSTIGGNILGMVLSSPAGGSLDDRAAVALPSDAEASLLASQGFVEWVTPLDPSVTYTAGIPFYDITVSVVGTGTVSIRVSRAGAIIIDEVGVTNKTYSVRHGDIIELVEAVGDFLRWEVCASALVDEQIVYYTIPETIYANPLFDPSHVKWVAYDNPYDIVAVFENGENGQPPTPNMLPLAVGAVITAIVLIGD